MILLHAFLILQSESAIGNQILRNCGPSAVCGGNERNVTVLLPVFLVGATTLLQSYLLVTDSFQVHAPHQI